MARREGLGALLEPQGIVGHLLFSGVSLASGWVDRSSQAKTQAPDSPVLSAASCPPPEGSPGTVAQTGPPPVTAPTVQTPAQLTGAAWPLTHHPPPSKPLLPTLLGPKVSHSLQLV